MEHHHPKCKHTAASPLFLLKKRRFKPRNTRKMNPLPCPEGSPGVVIRLSLRVLRVFRGFNCCFSGHWSCLVESHPPQPFALIPPEYLRSTSVLPPFHLRSTSASLVVVERRWNGGRTEVLGRYQRAALDNVAMPFTHHTPRPDPSRHPSRAPAQRRYPPAGSH